MLKQAAVLLAAVCWCLASVSGQRVPHPHHHKLDGFVAITHNGTEVRAARGVTIAMKVTGGEGQASTRTSNGRIIVEMNYINGSQLDSCKFIHGRFKLRHFYRKFLNHAPFSPAVHKAMAHRHNGTHEEVVKAVIAQGARVLKGNQRWTGAMMKEYGAMTNHLRAVYECRMWRMEHLSAAALNVSSVSMPHLSHEDGEDSDEDGFEDDDDEEENDEITRLPSEIDAIANSSSYGRALDRRNATVVPLDRKYILSSDKRNPTFWFDRRNGTDTRNGTYWYEARNRTDTKNGTSYWYDARNTTDTRNGTSYWWYDARNSTYWYDARNSTFWFDRRNGMDRRNSTVIDGRSFVSVDRKNVVSKWNWNGTAVDRRNATTGDRIKHQSVVTAQNATVNDRRFGEVGYRWNATAGDKYGRKNITRKMHNGRSKRHSMRRGPQHPHPHQHHGFVAVQGPDAGLPGTSEVRAARHGKLGMQTRVTTRDHNNVFITETTNGQTIVKTIAREGDSDELEDCDIIRGPLKMRKFYRKFLDDAPLGPAVVRATARRGHHGGPNGTHPHPHPHPHHRHHNNKMAVDRVTNRAWQSLNDSAHSWNDTLLDEYGQLTSFRKQMRRCKQWRKEHGRHHLTNQTTDASITSQSEEEKADHLIEGKRVKRQLYAGTKWCGAGSSTQDEKDMGHHREVDKCCQKHDECPYNIEAFTTKWGLFNHRLTTISLCECDFRFRTCLRNVGTETADSVGYIFFEVVSPTCFNFRYEDVCVERTWYGKCTRTERQPRAVSRESLSFN